MKSVWKTPCSEETYYVNPAEYHASGDSIRVQAFCHSRFAPEWRAARLARPCVLVSLILAGRDAYTTEEQGPVEDGPGTFRITDLNVPAEGYRRHAREPLERFFLLLENTRLLQMLLRELFPGDRPHFRVEPFRALRSCFEAVRDHLKQGRRDEVLLESLVFRLLREAASRQERRSGPEALDRALLYLENHFREKDLTCARVAAASGVGVTTLRLLFRRHLRCTVHRHIRDLRLERACHLLRTTDEPVGRIAEKCGYSYAYYLAREMKNSLRLTPLAWRRRERAASGDEGASC